MCALNFTFNSIKVRLKPPTDTAEDFAAVPFNSIKVRLKLPRSARSRLSFSFQFHKGAIETRCFRKCKLLIYNEVLREQSYDFIIKKCRWLIIYFCAFCDNRHNNWGYNKSKTSFFSKRFVIKALKNRSTTCITRNCRLPFFLFQVFVCSYYSPFCL